MPEFVCRKCLKGDRLSVSVTIHDASVGITPKPGRKPGRIDFDEDRRTRTVEWDSYDVDNYWCDRCELATARLEDLVVARPVFECRSCGFAGTDLAQHPETCREKPERVDPPEVHPAQTALLPRAA